MSDQGQTMMDLKDYQEEYRQELEQEGYETGMSCLESEPNPDAVSVPIFQPQQCDLRCSCAASPTKSRHNRTARRRLMRSPALNLASDAPLPPEIQQKMGQEDLDARLLPRGYAKISLPGNHSFHGPAPPERSLPAFLKAANPRSPQHQHGVSLSKPSSPLPPLHPLHRTTSDPTAATLPPLRRTSSDPSPAIIFSNVEESPESRRLKRMRHQLKEMSMWWDQLLRDEVDEQETEIHEEPRDKPTEKDGGEAENGQESVSVEEVGDCISIQFKCPCGRGYKILLTGGQCYYKLL